MAAPASAAVARRLGLCDPRVSVHMPGGIVQITMQGDYAVTMTGPVTRVSEGTLYADVFLEWP